MKLFHHSFMLFIICKGQEVVLIPQFLFPNFTVLEDPFGSVSGFLAKDEREAFPMSGYFTSILIYLTLFPHKLITSQPLLSSLW